MEKKLRALVLLALSGLLPSMAHAAGWQLPTNPGLPSDFDASIVNVINWMMGFVTLISVLVLIYGGMVYVASSADQERVGQAKKTIKYALMGLIMTGLAYAVVTLIVGTILKK